MAIIVSHSIIFFSTCWAAEPMGSFLGATKVCDIIIKLAALHIQWRVVGLRLVSFPGERTKIWQRGCCYDLVGEKELYAAS